MFIENRKNLRKSWAIIKEGISKKKENNAAIKFNINSTVITDKKKIADTFNNFYVNIGRNLAQNIPHNDKNPISFIKNYNVNSMFFTPVSEEEIITITSSLNNSSAGWDEMSAHNVKSTVHLFISPLTPVCNLSFLQGVFPRELKIAKVIPLNDDKMFVKIIDLFQSFHCFLRSLNV